MNERNVFKKGATSIYVVVISTLLFSVISIGFVRTIVNESIRSVSDELANAAYDSALAGVEDAKAALKKYENCKDNALPECERVKTYVEASFSSPNDSSSEPECDGVAKALGRIGETDSSEVMIQETTGNDGSSTLQAYTCVTLNNITADYRATLSSETPLLVIPLKPYGVPASSITGVKISWLSFEQFETNNYNFNNAKDTTNVTFNKSGDIPPTISAQIIQTATNYNPTEFESSNGDKTNRGTVFLTPSNSGDKTHIERAIVANSNDHKTETLAQAIKCSSGVEAETRLSEEFACVASIEIPAPINAEIKEDGSVSDRNADTFFLILRLPYGQPATDFAVQMCNDTTTIGDNKRGNCDSDSTVNFDNVQTIVDSTGRANYMYSRVEARVVFNDIYFPFPEFAVLATGDGDDAILKNFYVTQNCWQINNNSGSSAINECSSSGN